MVEKKDPPPTSYYTAPSGSTSMAIEIERLRKLVEEAYKEGYDDGEYEACHDMYDADGRWPESQSFRKLNGEFK
jgi:hypothetical protein